MKAEVQKATGSTSPAINETQIKEAEKVFQEKLALYRQTLTEKALLYDSLLSSAKSLVHRDDLVLKNEAEITRIRYEIELQALEMHQKKEIVAEMQNDLEKEKARYKALKVEIRRLEKRAE